MTVSPGATIANKYEISGAPVRGGMGDVHPARRLADSLPVAVKLLREELRDLPDALERFRREATAAERIHSEHVAEVLEVVEEPSVGIAIVFEYLDGETLEEVLKRERVMPLGRAHPLVCQILQGLADAHAVPVVHRDLKPANIFLQRMPGGSPRVKLVDFGISKTQQDTGAAVLTKVGQNLGSFSYMAPEQASAPSSVDQRADLYACGTVVFRMLTGQLPYVATSVGELIGKKTRQPARKLAEALPGASPPFPPALEKWVARMLERTIEARFGNAWEALETWEALASPAGNVEGKVGRPMPAPSPPHRPAAPPRQAGLSRGSAPRPSSPPRVAPVVTQPRAAPAPAPAPAAAPPRGPAPRVTRAKTMMGMGPVPAAAPAAAPPPAPPREEPMRPPSVPTRVERPQAAAEPGPVRPRPAAGRASGPGAAGLAPAPATPAPPRRPPPPPTRSSYEDDEPDEDESPTAMFVHPGPMKYDPDGPQEPAHAPSPAAGLPHAAKPAPAPAPPTRGVPDDDDEDYSEPPTAIHMPAYRPDEVPGAPPLPAEFRGAPMPSPIGTPVPAAGAPQAAPFGPAYSPPAQQAAPQHVAPHQQAAPQPAPVPAAGGQPFAPPGVVHPPAAMMMPQQPVQAMAPDQMMAPSHPSQVMPGTSPYAATPPPYDPDAAPLWLKAVAVSSLVSALTVLGVLGWMVVHRF